MYCPQCGTELPDNAKFCVSCRYDIKKITTLPEEFSSTDSLDSLDDLKNTMGDEGKPAPDDFKPGSLFANRYELLSEGQKGGMGTVYKCRDTKLNKTKALKVINPRLTESEQAIMRFRQEVAISQDLRHHNIVTVYDLDEREGQEYFTMEWIEGVTLREIIDERKNGKSYFSIEEATMIISQLSDALHYAHEHTVHRDIKPENILVWNKKGLNIKITDFGIAKMLSPSRFTASSIQMGTPYYMAPEQKTDVAQIDRRADIYAVGVVLFELLTLENTIGFELPSEINEGLPKEIDHVVKKAVATKPDNRYSDIEELAEALKAVARRVETGTRQSEEEKKKREAEKEQKIASLINEGKSYIESRNFNRAIEIFENIFKIDSSHIKAKALLLKVRNEKKRNEEEQLRQAEERKQSEEEKKKFFTDPVTGMEFLFVKGGCYEMGDTFGDGYDDEQPVHEVCVDDFYIGKYPVTQGQWKKVMGNNPSHFKSGDNYPVEQVSWDDVQHFIEKLNHQSDGKYRLPTEAEWEYACRSGGKKEKYAGSDDVDSVAWYDSNSEGITHQVGTKAPNGLGIYDMSGNVDEWVQDTYDEDAYKKHSRNNPVIEDSGGNRVIRGGSWDDNPWYVRCAHRNSSAPSNRNYYLGFRLLRTS